MKTTKSMKNPPQDIPHHQKAIRVANSTPYTSWPNLLDIQQIYTLKKHTDPPHPNQQRNHQTIDRYRPNGQNKSTQNHHQINYYQLQKAIAKFRLLLNTKPNNIYKKIFKPSTSTSLNCLKNSTCNIH